VDEGCLMVNGLTGALLIDIVCLAVMFSLILPN